MPNHASAKKRVRQTEKRTLRNKHVRSTCRTYMKRVRMAVAEGDVQSARKWLALAERHVARAVKKGVFHWKTGARYVSRLAAQVHRLERSGEAAA